MNTEINNMNGQTMVEYLLLVLMIALVALGAFVSFGGKVKSKTDYANEKF
jgi:Flp pilus assembly pilin Flp